MYNKKLILIIAVLFISITGVLASYNYQSTSLVNKYSTGDIIQGTINISFQNVSSKSVFTSNFPGNITLLDLLTANNFSQVRNYNCSTANCLSDYKVSDLITQLSLPANISKTIGFKVVGAGVIITDLTLSLSSNAPASCFRQLTLDVLAKNEKFMFSNNYTQISCGTKNYGCFANNLTSSDYTSALLVKNNPYCEKLTLPSAPAFKLGARIKNGNGSVELNASLYDSQGGLLKKCRLPAINSPEQDLECTVGYSSANQGDYFVCISASGDSNYTIKTETSGLTCGNNNPSSGTRDYEIYAQPLQFAQVALNLNKTSFALSNDNTNLVDYADSYLEEKYNRQCSPAPCIIPFALNPLGLAQEITINSASIKYKDLTTVFPPDSSVYLVNNQDSQITTNLLSVKLDPAKFTIPVDSTANTFNLFLNGASIISTQNLNISASFNFDIGPKFALLSQPTTFTVSALGNITSYTFDFGDETAKVTSSTNKTVHQYNSAGEVTLNVAIKKGDGTISSKDFTILVGDAKKSANLTITNYQTRLINISKNINALPTWINKQVVRKIDVSQINSSLTALKKRYNEASDDVAYAVIMSDLLKLDVPYSISTSSSGTLPIAVGFNQINPAFIKEISNDQSSEDASLKKGIVSWMSDNYDAQINFETISQFKDSGQDPLLTKFKITLNPKSSLDGNYLFIAFPQDSITFSSILNEKKVGTDSSPGTEVPLSSDLNTVEFLIPSSVDASDLGAYISPVISRLGVIEQVNPCNSNNICEANGENKNNCPADCHSSPWLWIIILLVVMFIVYIALQEWYKKKYERYLFKNPDSLYNLINFIHNSRKLGMKDQDIRQKLLKAGWTREQIDYAFRKIDGKRTGMYEIPLFKFIERNRVNQEIAKRQQKPQQIPQRQGDVRFIKRSRF